MSGDLPREIVVQCESHFFRSILHRCYKYCSKPMSYPPVNTRATEYICITFHNFWYSTTSLIPVHYANLFVLPTAQPFPTTFVLQPVYSLRITRAYPLRLLRSWALCHLSPTFVVPRLFLVSHSHKLSCVRCCRSRFLQRLVSVSKIFFANIPCSILKKYPRHPFRIFTMLQTGQASVPISTNHNISTIMYAISLVIQLLSHICNMRSCYCTKATASKPHVLACTTHAFRHVGPSISRNNLPLFRSISLSLPIPPLSLSPLSISLYLSLSPTLSLSILSTHSLLLWCCVVPHHRTPVL